MPSPDILTVCGSAFVAIFALLAFLAGLMRLLVYVFPVQNDESDAAVFAAITAVYHHTYPDSKISEIKEEK